MGEQTRNTLEFRTHLLHLSLHRYSPLLSRRRKSQEWEINIFEVDLGRDSLVERRERRTNRFGRYCREKAQTKQERRGERHICRMETKTSVVKQVIKVNPKL